MRKSIIFLLSAGLMASGSVLADHHMDKAAEEPLPSEQTFTSIDQDGDGFIQEAEAAGDTRLVSDWEMADLDRDGVLSAQEYAVYAGEATAAGQPETEPKTIDETLSD